MCECLWRTPKISRKFARGNKVSSLCSFTAGTKRIPSIMQLSLNISHLFKALGMHFSKEVKQRCTGSECIHSCLPVCLWGWSPQFANLSLNLSVPDRTPGHMTHTGQPKNSSIQGIEHFKSGVIAAFSVLTATKTLPAGMVYSSRKCTSCASGGVVVTGFKWSLKYSLHTPRLSFP